jgi:hypothetical protein
MGLLSHKPKVSVEEFCQWYFDTTIFSEDAQTELFDHVFNFVAEADQSFTAIDKALFKHEMTALYMELFGLAWDRRYEKLEYILPAIVCTKNYLGQKGRLEIWNTMLAYNQAIAQSGIQSLSADILSNVKKAKELLNQSEEVRIAGLNYMRVALAKKFEGEGFDAECAARAANRQGIEIAWEKDLIISLLTARFADRLGCDIILNDDAQGRLLLTILGILEGATQSMKKMRISFTD